MSQPQTGNEASGQDKSRDAPAHPKEHGTWHKPAVLLVGGPDGHLIGDSSLVGGKLRMKVGSFKPPNQPSLDPWLGLKIEFPRAKPEDTKNSGFGVCFNVDYSHTPPVPKTSETLTITLKFCEVMVDIFARQADIRAVAGAIGRADALSVLGNTGRPSILCGDHNQLKPFIGAPIGDDEQGRAANRHVADGRNSALAWHHFCGMPSYRMRVQLRMARGQFDLAGGIIYRDLPWTYGDRCEISEARHEPGRKLEKFILGRFPGVKKSPEDTLLPVVLHCPGQVIVQPETLSKSNPVQIKVTVKFIVELVQEMKIDPKEIVIITPYKWAADKIKSAVDKHACLKGMPDAATVDSFHGSEGVLAFFISISNSESGPGFVSDRNRLSVAETRQQSGLVITGDKYVMGKKATVDKNETAKSIRIPGPDGEMHPISPGALLETMRRLIELDRIADDRNPELSGLAQRDADREAMGLGKGLGKGKPKAKDKDK